MKMNMENISKIEEKIGYKFEKRKYIRIALTRRSYAIEHNKRSTTSVLSFWEILF